MQEGVGVSGRRSEGGDSGVCMCVLEIDRQIVGPHCSLGSLSS